MNRVKMAKGTADTAARDSRGVVLAYKKAAPKNAAPKRAMAPRTAAVAAAR
jgi:hypothetical protein